MEKNSKSSSRGAGERQGARYWRELALLILFATGVVLSTGSVRAQDYHASMATKLPVLPHSRANTVERQMEKLNTVISLDLDDVTILEALKHITGLGDLKLIYGKEAVSRYERISLKFESITILEALHETIRNTDLSLQLSPSGYIIVIRKVQQQATPASDPERSNAAIVQHEVSGHVTSQSDGQSLPGVNITVKGPVLSGTVSDLDGAFNLTVPSPDDTLVFSYVGFQTQEIPIAGRSIIDVAMVGDDLLLDDVIVVGYGEQVRRNITGAVSAITAETIKDLPVTSLEEAIAGRMAGVEVQQMSGAPGGGISVTVRGLGSITAGTQPLYVIDGYPVGANEELGLTSNPLNTINPSDVESIQVLKDASATAIYGSRGSNGVVIIKTKQGRIGKPQFSFDSYIGIQEINRTIKMTNAWQYAEMQIEALNNQWVRLDPVNHRPDDPNEVRNQFRIGPWVQETYDSRMEGTDWQAEFYRPAPVQSYQISASGGSEAMRYYVSGSVFQQDGIVLNSSFQRYSMRANLDLALSPTLRLGLNFTPTYTLGESVQTDVNTSDATTLFAVMTTPLIPAYNEDGTYATSVIWELETGPAELPYQNPLIRVTEVDEGYRQFRTLGSIFANWEITPHLTLRAEVGGDLSGRDHDFFQPANSTAQNLPAFGTSSTTFYSNWLNENTLTYARNLGAHDITALVGFTAQRNIVERNSLRATDFQNDLVRTLNAGRVTEGASNRSEWGLLSYLSRIIYSYRGKYLLTGTVRTDGSSRFGEDNRWGVFPSISAGWIVTEEPFMQNVRGLDLFKVRGSFGFAGNNAIPDYGYVGKLDFENYVFGRNGGDIVTGLYPSTTPNPELGWEKSRQVDVGIDVALFGYRANVIADYYHKLTSDLLLLVPVPVHSGYTEQLTNIGQVQNQGFEFGLNTFNLVGKFKWETNFNISFNRNKVLQLGPEGAPIDESTQFGNTHRTEVGKPIGNYYGYIADGVFMDEEDVARGPLWGEGTPSESVPGSMRFVDVNGDGKITPDDRTLLGNAQPDFIFGITNTFRYKNADLRVSVNGVKGRDVLNETLRHIGNFRGGALNQLMEIYEGRWRSPENPGNGKVPALNSLNIGNSSAFSTFFIEDGSYLNVRDITLGYMLPQSITQGDWRARLYLSVKNAFLLTRYSGYNPDISSEGSNPLLMGVDRGGYPLQRIYTLGFNISF